MSARRIRAATLGELRVCLRSFADALVRGVSEESFEQSDVAALLARKDVVSTVPFGPAKRAVKRSARGRPPRKAAPLAEVLPMLNIPTNDHVCQAVVDQAVQAFAPFDAFRPAIGSAAAHLLVLTPSDGDRLPTNWAWPVEDVVGCTRIGNGVAAFVVERRAFPWPLVNRVVLTDEERERAAQKLADWLLKEVP